MIGKQEGGDVTDTVVPTQARQAAKEARVTARVQRRRRQILAAATHLMQRSGFHAMSMQSVADEANVEM